MPMRREQVAAALQYLGDKADLKRRYERMVSLDQPQDSDAVDMAVEMGASIVPGVGQALAARDFERARRADDEAGMAMAAASAVPVGRLIGALKGFDPAMREIKAYHGTADDFDVFDPAMGGRATGAISGKQATWFTDDPKTAQGYAVFAAENAPVRRKLEEADKLEQIAQRTNKQQDWDKYDAVLEEAEKLEAGAYDRRIAKAQVMEVDIPDATDLFVVDAKGKTPQELSAAGDIDSWLKNQLAMARKKGKQGVQIKNLDDAAGLANAPATHYAVFDPTGVKVLSKKKLIEKK
jgi:hypothetical protein